MAADWTMLVYMAGDNNLDSVTTQYLDAMKVAKSADVNVLVQRDRLGRNTERIVAGDGNLKVDTLSVNVNFGEPASLTKFLTDGKAKFPNTNYVVVLLDHGLGWLDFPEVVARTNADLSSAEIKSNLIVARTMFHSAMVDAVTAIGEDFSNPTGKVDFLDNNELQTGLENALGGQTFAVVGCDACYMSMVEVAHQIRKCGDLFVASENRQELAAWPYATILPAFKAGLKAGDVAKIVVSQYGATVKGPNVLSAVKLGEMDFLAQALDELGKALMPTLKSGNFTPIENARFASAEFALYSYIDLVDFANNLMGELTADAGVVAAAQAVVKAVSNAVIENTPNAAAARAHGLAIYVPNASVDPKYAGLSLSNAAPNWHDFVVAYGDHF